MKRLPWTDALRILRKRRDVGKGLSETSLADSIQAFLAWKAFIIVARGITPAGREKNQCQELLRQALGGYEELLLPARQFVRGLEALSKQTDGLLQDWYCEEDWQPAEKTERITRMRKSVSRLAAERREEGLRSARSSYDIGENMYAVRSAVIAHASVSTSGNLFPHIVGPFGELASLSACAGIALRAAVQLQEVIEQADVAQSTR